ncbi:MAG: hypothetical protein ACHQ4F_03655 [Candidatus Dormibacteria bacterium]
MNGELVTDGPFPLATVKGLGQRISEGSPDGFELDRAGASAASPEVEAAVAAVWSPR